MEYNLNFLLIIEMNDGAIYNVKSSVQGGKSNTDNLNWIVIEVIGRRINRPWLNNVRRKAEVPSAVIL